MLVYYKSRTSDARSEEDSVEEIAETIVMTDDMTEEEFEARVIAILELERKNIGRTVVKMMENEEM